MMSWKNFLTSLACRRAKIPPRSFALAAGAITCHNFHYKSLVRPEYKIELRMLQKPYLLFNFCNNFDLLTSRK